MGEGRFERFAGRDSINSEGIEMLRHILFIGVVAALTSGASATTRSSFIAIDSISGITVTPTVGLSYEVALTTMPTFSVNNQNIVITDLIGYYALSDDNNLSPLASLSPVANFSDDSSNSGPGGIAGWRSNPNQGITPGNMLTFTFNGLDLASVERWGFHVRVEGTFPGTEGNTGNITVVPTPGAAVPVAAMGLMALRRRRR
jgi:hypothetical protein